MSPSALPLTGLPITGTRLVAAIILVAGLSSLSGCASAMAWNAPPRKDLSVMNLGTSRSRVIAEIGKPVETTETEFGIVDVYSFKQGYTLPTRATRATAHAVGDIFTVFLWEIPGVAIEASMRGEEVRAEICYDHSHTIQRIEFFEGAHLSDGSPALARWVRSDTIPQTAIYENPGFRRNLPIGPEVQVAGAEFTASSKP